MFDKSFKKILFCSLVISLSACSTTSTPSNITDREKLYESTKNYNALISLYRDELKSNENPVVRYKLANSYYRIGDSKSSLLYLTPLLTGNTQLAEQATILQVRNLIQTHEYDNAINVATAFIAKNPKNGDAYNLRGIALAQKGRLSEASQDINKARGFFINDIVAVNNLAMLNIINADYRNAVELLLPQYLNGEKDQRLVHNLVFALVKSGDIDYAKDIIVKERLNTSPDDLIEALKKTERLAGDVRR